MTGVLVDDETEAPVDSGKARIKFVHLIPNVDAVDFYRGAELLKAKVNYKEATVYFDVNAGNATYIIKQADSTANLASRAINPVAGRIYTFFGRGYKGGATAIGPNVSALTIQ